MAISGEAFHQFIADVVNEIREEQKALRESILNGDPATFEDYRRSVGELKGLEVGAQLIIEKVKGFINDDN